MESPETVVVRPADFQSVSRKLGQFSAELKPNEKEIMAWMLSLAGGLFPAPLPPLRIHYKPRGAKMLVLGGADGLTVLFGRGGFTIIPPEGPLPTDFLGAALVLGEKIVG